MAVLRMLVGLIDVFSSYFSVGTCITVLIPIGITGDTLFFDEKKVLPPSQNSCPVNKIKGVLIGCLLVILP